MVVVTKYRRKCINSPMLERLKTICTELTQKRECELLEFNGAVDHAYLLLSLNPKVAPLAFVNNLMMVSSRMTCGGTLLSVIEQYFEQ